MTRPVGLCAAALSIALAAGGEAQSAPQASPSPTPRPSPTPSPSPEPTPLAGKPLRLDIEGHVQRALESPSGPPRFETTIEVEAQSAQAAFERQLQGFDLECGPAGGGPPTEVETRAVRPHLSPSADFLALGRWVASKLKKKGSGRYFLYRVRSARGVSYSLRGEPITDALLRVPGTTFELVASFPDRDSATRAWQRLEQGFVGPAPAGSTAAPVPPWTTAPCRPKPR